MLKLRIMNQAISKYETSRIVADSQGYLRFTIETSEDWNEYVKVAQFERDGVIYDVANVKPGVEYIVPWQALIGEGEMFVSLYGVSGSSNRATTNDVRVEIIESGFHQGNPATDPPDDKWNQFVQQVKDDADRAESAANTASTLLSQTTEQANRAVNAAAEAKQSETAAAQSAKEAKTSENKAANYAEAAETYTKVATDAAIQAQASQIAAKASETKAGEYADQAATSRNNALESEQNAQLSAEDAATSKAISIQQANRAEEQANIAANANASAQEAARIAENAAAGSADMKNEIEALYKDYKQSQTYIDFTDGSDEDDEWEGSTDDNVWRLEVDTNGQAVFDVMVRNDDGELRPAQVNYMFSKAEPARLIIESIKKFNGTVILFNFSPKDEETT